MYTGHFGLALLGKGARPRVPLWALVGGVFAMDLIEIAGELLGLPGPVVRGATSAAAAVAWAVLLGGAYGLAYRDGAGGTLIGAGVLSHTLVDMATNATLLWPGGPAVGGPLYDYPAWDFVAEALLVLAGWLWYRRTLAPPARRSRISWALLLGLLACQALFDLRTAEVWSFSL